MSLESAIQHLLKAKRISNVSQSYAKDNPAEWQKVKTYLEGGARPTGVTTEMGLGLIEVEDAKRGVTPPPPPPPPPTGWPASYFTGPAGQGIILPPKKGCFVGAAGSNDPSADAQLVALEQLSGRKLDIEHRYLQNRTTIDYGTGVSTDSIAGTVNRGHIPLLSWSLPANNGGDILRGQHDAGIRQFARELAAQPHKIFLRFLWEFNGSWYSASWDSDGTRLTDIEQRDLFRHFVDILKAEGANEKASIVWCPGEVNIDGATSADWPNKVRNCYPGDAYCDWVGSDGYNFYPGWCGYHYGWCSFKQIFDADPPDAADTHVSTIEGFPHKPFMVAEVGCREDPAVPGRKGEWIKDSGTYIEQSLPSLHAYVWFDMNYTDGDHRVRSSASSTAGWKDMVNRPYFNTRGV